MSLRLFAARIASLFRSARMDRDLDDEIRDHLERAAADLRDRGLSRDDAEAAAAAAFGSRLRVKEAHAAMRGLPLVEELWRDIRHARRTYARSPRFAALVTLTLGFGVGAASAIFALVYAVVLRPLPFATSDRLVSISGQHRDSAQTTSVSPPDYFDLKEQGHVFAGLAAYWSPTVVVSPIGGTPDRVFATVCTPNLMEVLGVLPEMGRPFTAADGDAGTARVAIVSDALWRGRFGSDPSIVGRELLIDDARVQVVGVMPPGVDFPSRATELWMPLRLSRTEPPNPAIPPQRYRQYRILSIVGRLDPGVSLSTARAELTLVADRLERDHPDANRRMTLTVAGLHDALVGDVRPAMLVLFGAVACLLLVAVANVATMIAVRTSSRERELAVRLALGAGRGRVVRQLLVESALLACTGGAAGLALSYVFLPLVVRFAPAGIPRIETARIDAATVLFTVAAASFAGMVFGLAPAAQVGRRELGHALKAGTRSTTAAGRHRFRRLLVAAQVGVSMLLLVTAGLLVQSFLRLGAVDLGFRSAGVFTIERLEVDRRATPAATAAFFDDVLKNIRAVRGVDAAGITLGVPLDARGRFFVDDTAFTIEPFVDVPQAERPNARIHVVSDGYFATLGISVIAGRSFADTDRRDAPAVVIVNKALADRYFPSGDAVGRTLTHELSIVPGQPVRRRIIGVVGDVRQFRLDEPFEPQIFVPHSQMPWPAMALVVRTSLPLDQLSATVRTAVWSRAPRMPVPIPSEMRQTFDAALGAPRLRAWLMSLFAVAAMMLSAMGLYGTVAFAIQQRRSELAIRLALGATPRQTCELLLREGVTLSLAGALSGVLAAVMLTRLLSSLLFGVGALDPATIAGVGVLLIGVSVAACYLPARSAASINPLSAINGD
jgi:predicted permease